MQKSPVINDVPSKTITQAKNASFFIFFICGLGLSAWAPMVPFAKDRLGLNDGGLGLLLLLLGGGGMLLMPLSGMMTARYGSRKVIALASVLIGTTLPVLAFGNSVIVMGSALFLFGGGIGMVDVAMNTHGIAVQNKYNKPIFSMLHGLFSVGALFGALTLGLLFKSGLEPLYATIVISLIIVITVAIMYKRLLSNESESIARGDNKNDVESVDKKQKLTWLKTEVLVLGFMCFSFFLVEGAMLDWSAIFLRDVKKVSLDMAGIGYAAFSVAMATMRLLGDRIISKYNNRIVVIGGSLIAITGLVIAITSPYLPIVLTGFVLIGIGAANTVPVFFSEGGKIKGVSSSIAISAITTMGYAGQLAGPAMLGYIAQISSLTISFIFLAILLLIVVVLYQMRQRSAA